jgi:hypothetical protein
MIQFKQVTIGCDSFGVKHRIYRAEGLPEGSKCYYAAEEADRPRGAWYVAVTKGGKKRTIRCKSKAEAEKKAAEWCAPRRRKTKGATK